MFREGAYLWLLLLIVDKSLCQRLSICASVPHGYFVRSSQSCNAYNRCMNGQPMHGVCPKGFYFNPKNLMCDYNVDVDCRMCSPLGIQNIPNPDNCQMYYRCANGLRTSMTCSDGLLFDRNFGDCNVAQRVQCEKKNDICEPFSWMGSVAIGDPLDCSSFHRCVDGTAYEAACPTGLFYNPNSGYCEAQSNRNFCQGYGPFVAAALPEKIPGQYVNPVEETAKTTLKIVYFSTTVAPQ